MLLKEIKENKAILTLNRPREANSLNGELFRGLTRELELMATDERIRVLIITASKAKAFCAGIDLKERATKSSDEILLERETIIRRFYSTLAGFSKPVIAAVNGPVLGGGAELILACDIRLATGHASFAQSEINWGMIPSCGACQRLRLLTGVGVAKEIILSGRRLSAEEAFRVGIYNRLVPEDELMAESLKLAQSIAAHSPVAVRQAKKVLDIGSDIYAPLEFEFEASKECFFSGDALNKPKIF